MEVEVANVLINQFYLRKIATYFRGIHREETGRGVLTRRDHELFAARYSQLANLDQLHQAQTMRKMITLWEFLFEDISKKVALTPEMMAKCLAYLGREKIIMCASHFGDILFDLIDLNGDGVISVTEFCLLHKLFFLNDETARAAFKVLDKENKGEITHGSFISAVIDFFLPDGQAASPTSIIFGPLVDSV